MKKCPTCNRDYDDAQGFCLADGATLVRTEQTGDPTMTMPAQPAFQPPTLRIPVEPSMSTTRSLTNIFFAPARVFDSFRDVTTFTSAVVRFLVPAAIIVVAMVAYNVIYLARIGPQNIARASIEAYPKLAGLPAAQKERALQMQQSPAIAITRAIGFGKLIIFTLASLPLGALIYWLGGLIFKSKIKYMQALLVWTYATFAPTVLWTLANTITLFIRPPTTNIAIATGADTGVIHANLGALFNVTMLPIPVYVVALGVLDLFEFYGLALAMFGLRKVARIPWLGSFGIVIFVWLIGVVWRISTAGLIGALMK